MQKILHAEIELWTGIRNKIPLCCILFYESVWYPLIKNEIADYAKTMSHLTDNSGIVLCPKCLQKKLIQNPIQDYENTFKRIL